MFNWFMNHVTSQVLLNELLESLEPNSPHEQER